MPSNARKDIVREGEVATYHCWSRVVQRAFLCGQDPVTGRDFDYRRAWIEDLLKYQARVFAIDLGNFNLLHNHAHTILRTRPDIAATWSDEQLALRWKMAWPEFCDGQWIREPTEEEIERLLTLPEKLAKIRRDLSSLSWFMARWKEPIARLCNAEMDRTGHFWEARFGSRELLDDAAVLTCNVYVDLNQVTAGMAASLEESRHSSICNRILAAKRREARASREEFVRQSSADYSLPEMEAEALYEDCWLAPIGVGGPLLTSASLPGPMIAETSDRSLQASDDLKVEGYTEPAQDSEEVESSSVSASRRLTRPRASDSPIVDVPWPEYLRVVECMAARTRSVEPDSVSSDHRDGSDQLEDVLARWGINAAAWLREFERIDNRCTRAMGAADQMVRRAGEVAQRWFQGIGWCREVFVNSESTVDGCT